MMMFIILMRIELDVGWQGGECANARTAKRGRDERVRVAGYRLGHAQGLRREACAQ
jgi:hypothetical protein